MTVEAPKPGSQQSIDAKFRSITRTIRQMQWMSFIIFCLLLLILAKTPN
jgi:hypothetical protein